MLEKQWGFTQTSFSNGAAYADLDNDGDLDLIVNNENAPAFVYKNNSREINKNHIYQFHLKGIDENTFAIGSKIKLYAGQSNFYQGSNIPAEGFNLRLIISKLLVLGKINTSRFY